MEHSVHSMRPTGILPRGQNYLTFAHLCADEEYTACLPSSLRKLKNNELVYIGTIHVKHSIFTFLQLNGFLFWYYVGLVRLNWFCLIYWLMLHEFCHNCAWAIVFDGVNWGI